MRKIASSLLCSALLGCSISLSAQTPTPSAAPQNSESTQLMVTAHKAQTKLPTDAPIAGRLSVDDGAVKGAYYVNAMWVMPHAKTGATGWEREPIQQNRHLQSFAFLGSDLAHPEELNGEVEFWLGDEKHIITKSSVVFVPTDLMHGPIIYRNVKRPIREIHVAATPTYQAKAKWDFFRPETPVTQRAGSKHGQLIFDKMNPRYEGLDPTIATNNLITSNVPGANYFDSGLIKKNPPNTKHKVVYGYRGTHRHNEAEIFIFMGVNPQQPATLGAELDMMIGGNTFDIKQPAIVVVPKNTTHVPINYRTMTADVWEAMMGPLPHKDWSYIPEPNSGSAGVVYTSGEKMFGANLDSFAAPAAAPTKAQP